MKLVKNVAVWSFDNISIFSNGGHLAWRSDCQIQF